MEKTAKWVERKLSNLGILDRYTWVILCGMILADGTYWEAVNAWADVTGCSKEWVNSHCCYSTLAAGLDEHPEKVFQTLVREYKEETHED